jgi:hypothetical protein
MTCLGIVGFLGFRYKRHLNLPLGYLLTRQALKFGVNELLNV